MNHANLGPRNADSFRSNLHSNLKADFVPAWKDFANPPFNMSDWGGENLWRTCELLLSGDVESAINVCTWLNVRRHQPKTQENVIHGPSR